MKTTLLIFLLTTLFSCASILKSTPKMGKEAFNYTDVSGSYHLTRESKIIKRKLVTRSQLFSMVGGGQKLVEKSITVSQIGSTKGKKTRALTVRPLASEFTVWLEGKKYYSKMSLNTKTKSLQIDLDSPESKWKGSSSIKFPRGHIFCFFSQLAECLYQGQLLERVFDGRTKRADFYVVWDSYPYTSEQFANLGGGVFAPATVRYDGVKLGLYRFEVEVDGQILLYYFSKSFDFVKMSWIAQGLTISPPEEEQDSEE